MLPLFHVAGIVIGLLSTLATGGCVVLAPAFDPLAFPALLREHRVTWFTAVPTIFKGLLEHRALFSGEGKEISSLRFIRSGAAAIDAAEKRTLEQVRHSASWPQAVLHAALCWHAAEARLCSLPLALTAMLHC